MTRRVSVVVERLRPWTNRRVRVRFTHEKEPIAGVIADVLPIGVEYFVSFVGATGRERLVNVRSIVEIVELEVAS